MTINSDDIENKKSKRSLFNREWVDSILNRLNGIPECFDITKGLSNSEKRINNNLFNNVRMESTDERFQRAWVVNRLFEHYGIPPAKNIKNFFNREKIIRDFICGNKFE